MQHVDADAWLPGLCTAFVASTTRSTGSSIYSYLCRSLKGPSVSPSGPLPCACLYALRTCNEKGYRSPSVRT
eukprot:2545563-Pleurochrysis_carterae.AAC.1